jgi:phenylacetate-CoA ligase
MGLSLIPHRLLLGTQFRETFMMIKQTEFLPGNKLRKRTEENLAKILSHAYRTTGYYADLFQRLGTCEKDILKSPLQIISGMPFINKSTIRDNYSLFLSDTNNKTICDYTSTGGTSGEPFYFHINSDRSAKELAYFIDQWERVGFTLNSKRVTFRGSPINRKKGWENDWVTRERKFSSFELTDEYLERIWPDLCAYGPDFVYAYPSTALALCQFIERSGKRLPENIKAILVGSENIYNGQEDYLEAVTRRRVYKWYGHSEKLILAGECEKSKYYHAYPQYGYVEFINEKGKLAKPGDFAEIVGTGFINTVLPFIRYRTGDYCTYLGEYCPQCGRYYPIFKDVRGRWTQEVLYGKKGNSICMSAINVHSDNLRNVFRYQFYQDTPGRALLKIMPNKGFSQKDKRAIEKELNFKFNGNIVIDAKVVQNIPLSPRGKYKFIDQNTSTKLLPAS